MDLVTCSECERRFYASNAVDSPVSFRCPHCGGALGVTLHRISSIPVDARWLDSRSARQARESTIVDLRCKRWPGGTASERIIAALGDYFDVRGDGRSLEVRVNRGAPDTAALRVAAVLDGVDADWERHFYLPTTDHEDPAASSDSALLRETLRLIMPPQNGTEPESA